MTDELLRLLVFGAITLAAWAYYRRRTVAAKLRYLTDNPRVWAYIVDSGVALLAGILCEAVRWIDAPWYLPLYSVMMAAASVAWFGYKAQMHARYGQTLGKMITKVRVVDYRTGGAITTRQAWLRESVPGVLSLVWWTSFVCYLLFEVRGVSFEDALAMAFAGGFTRGVAWVVWKSATLLTVAWYAASALTLVGNKKRRALHDFIAGTVVVRVNTAPDVVPAGPEANVVAEALPA